MRPLVNLMTAGLVALVLGGCFSPRPDPSKFFVLAPLGTAAGSSMVPAGLATSTAPTIGLGPVKLPEYLDRDEVVTRVGPNRLQLSNEDRWAEPLDNNFKQVVAEDLTRLMGTQSITFYPWPLTTHIDYQVRIDVYRFETDTSSKAELVAHWQVLDGSGKLLYANDANLSDQTQPGESAASALSRTVEALARQIAFAIQSLAQGKQAGPGVSRSKRSQRGS